MAVRERRPCVRMQRIIVGLTTIALWLSAFAPARAAGLPVFLLSKDRLGLSCFDRPDTHAALECWLNQHPDVAGAMFYSDAAYSGTWPTWPATLKTQLDLVFDLMVVWYKAGMPANFPQPFPVPIPELGAPDPVYGFWMSYALGKRVYLTQLANRLSAELTAAFPWSIAASTAPELNLLLSMGDTLYHVDNVANPGYFFQEGGPSPATPVYTINFFKTNNLIGSDAADTIERLFAWERQLIHFFYVSGDPTVNVYPYFWGPNTPPIPDSAVIEGTTYTGPVNAGFGHYTAGCSGTMEFMKSVLRSINIPVELHWVSCQHATPIFPTAGLAMTHGDDPYDRLGWVTPYPGFPVPQTSEYLVTIAQHDQLFPANQDWDECTHNVGIQVANVAIKYGSDYLMNLYCQDLMSGADHASGQVYNTMQWYYPLQTLENMGLWTTLDTKVMALNYCGF